MVFFVVEMSLFISSLNSGSNGNCYYVGNENEAVLVDVGISCREVEKRMKRLGLQIEKIKAIFISHEHSDHIRGLETTSKKNKIPVYITDPTLKNSNLKLDPSLVFSFKSYAPVSIGGLSVIAFPKLHDAADPFSFVVECNGVKAGVFTDIGSNCKDVVQNFKECHAVFLEANYDEKMLEEGGYPFYLKKRIRSEKGHLSNDQSLELFTKHRSQFMSHLILSHLSKNNNCPMLVHELFTKHAGNTHISVASRYKESEVHHIHKGSFKEPVKKQGVMQMSLF